MAGRNNKVKDYNGYIPPNRTDMMRMNFDLDIETVEQIKQHPKLQDMSMSGAMRLLVEWGLIGLEEY